MQEVREEEDSFPGCKGAGREDVGVSERERETRGIRFQPGLVCSSINRSQHIGDGQPTN